MNDNRPHHNPPPAGQSPRVPPQATEVEEAVLGACLIEEDSTEAAIGVIGRRPDVFYKHAHRLVWEALVDLHAEGEATDMLTVESLLRDRGQLGPAGGSEYLAELTRSVSSFTHIEGHCKILLGKWAKRELILESTDSIKEAYNGEMAPEDVVDRARTRLDKVAGIIYRDTRKYASEMLREVLDDIEKRRENPGINGTPTGLPIDKYTGGWQAGNLYIIAARPSMGKTALAIKAAFNAALFEADRYRAPIYYANLEMENYDIIKRQLALQARVNYTKMRDGKLSDIEMKRLVEAAGHIFKGKVILDDTPGMHVNEFRAKYKAAVHRDGVKVGFVDYLQLMTGKGEGTREQEVASISRGLKAAAKETHTAIVALSQLSRECEKRPGAEPRLSDLRESGSLEQDSDGVIMLNRPEFFGHAMFKDRDTGGKGHVKIEKMRNGMTGDFWMNFEKMYADWTPERGGGEDQVVPEPRARIPKELFEDGAPGDYDLDNHPF